MVKSRTSLRYILTRNYIFLSLLPVLLFGMTTLYLLSGRLTEEVSTQNYSLATSIAGEVNFFLKEPLSLILQMSEVLSTPRLLSQEGVSVYLDSVVNNYPLFEMVQLVNAEGRVSNVAPYEEEYIGIDMSRQEFYTKTLKMKEPFWSSTFISMRSGSPTLSLSVTTKVGMVVGYLNLDILSSVVQKLSNEHRYAVITDQEGTVVADYNPLRVQHRENLRNLKPFREGVEDIGTFVVKDQDNTVLASVVPIHLTGWRVIFFQHYENALAPVTHTRNMLFIGILMTIAFATLAALYIARSTSRPFIELVKNVQRVADGDYALTQGTDGFLEIRELDDTFRDMAAAIRQREQIISESERIHRELIEALPYGIQENDIEGTITFTNPAYDRIFECLSGEAIGKPIWETETTLPKKERLQKYFQHIVTEQPPPKSHVSQARTYSGNLIDIQVDWRYKRDQDGNVEGLISVITDISEKMRLESNLRQAQKMEAIGTLAGGIAHDFNNILSAIMGYSELIIDNLAPGSVDRGYQEQIIKASCRARDLVQRLLIFSRKQEHQKGPVKISRVVSEAVKLLRASLPTTIEFDLQIAEDTGVIEADDTQIHQVVINLCTNAGHAMEVRGGTLSVSLQRVELEVADGQRPPELAPGSYALLQVGDDGDGIASEDISKIFDPFFTTKATGKGTGMGLAVVHGIVSSFGGAITVVSEEGVGTVFDVFFPLIDRSVTEEVQATESSGRRKGHILIVDDEEAIINLTSELLERTGYTTTTSTDSNEALTLFLETPNAFDLLITDQTMPGLTGIELSRRISSERVDLPIILCTGYSKIELDEQIQGAGITATLVKPISRKTLVDTIDSLLS
jgi:PAS domain S-box-containing protein